MKTKHPALVGSLAVMVLTGACGSSASDDGGTVTDAGSDGGRMRRDSGPPPSDSCGQPGIPGNENGVGAFCTPSGHECAAYPLAPLCVVDVDPVDGQWYCTRLCSMTSECGSAAICYGDARGMGCLPSRCDYRDAGPDDAATTDASAPDGGADDAGTSDGGTTDAGVADAGSAADA